MGELAALAAAAMWAAATLIFAAAGARVPAVSLNLLKTGLAFPALLFTLWALHGGPFVPELSWVGWGWLAVSGVLGLTLGDSFYFVGLRLLGARRALVLWALTPAATALLAAPVLGEALTPSFGLGLTATSVGVAVVLLDQTPSTRGLVDEAPGRGRAFALGIAAGLGAVLCMAGGNVTAKLGGAGLSGLELAVIRLGFGTLTLLPPGLWALFRAPVRLDRAAVLQVSAGTFLGTYLGIWLSMAALQRAFAGVVATLQSTSPIFALPMARVLGEPIGPRAAAGAALAVAGVAILTLS